MKGMTNLQDSDLLESLSNEDSRNPFFFTFRSQNVLINIVKERDLIAR